MGEIYQFIIISQAIVIFIHILIVTYLLNRDTHYGQTSFVVFTLLCAADGMLSLDCILSKSIGAVSLVIELESFVRVYIPITLLIYIYRLFHIRVPKKILWYMAVYNIIMGHICLTNNYYHLLYSSIKTNVFSNYTQVILEPGPCFTYFIINDMAITIWIVVTIFYLGSKHKEINRSTRICTGFIAICVVYLAISLLDTNPQYRIRSLVSGILCIIIFSLLYHYEMFNVTRTAGERVFQNLGQPLLIVDKKRRLLEYNDVAEMLFPKLATCKSGSKVDLIYPELIDIFEKDEVCDVQLRDRIYEGRASKIYYHQKISGYVVCLLDVTNQRIYMKQLIEMKKNAENANTAKSDFLSRMSHDMRTPMNAVIGMTEIANRSLDNKEVVENCLNNVQHSANYLLALINDILELAKIENDKMKLNETQFNMKDLFYDIEILIKSLLEKKNIQYEIIDHSLEHELFYGDDLRIKQILMNVITNAIKFTPQDGKVTVHRKEHYVDDENSVLEFNIEDNGIGMSEEKAQIIFAPFEQGDDSIQSQYGGSGLGLSISRQLLSLMDGTIEVESELGKGSIFTICIPLRTADACKKVEEKQEEQYNFQGRRVLLVEDNEMNIEVSKMILLMQNLRVEVARNGLSAVNMYIASPEYYYDYILMDVRMPVMDGLEATRRIRESERKDAKQVPIIAMTANAYEEDVRKVKESGMNEHLEKPIDVDRLVMCLKKYEENYI